MKATNERLLEDVPASVVVTDLPSGCARGEAAGTGEAGGGGDANHGGTGGSEPEVPWDGRTICKYHGGAGAGYGGHGGAGKGGAGAGGYAGVTGEGGAESGAGGAGESNGCSCRTAGAGDPREFVFAANAAFVLLGFVLSRRRSRRS